MPVSAGGFGDARGAGGTALGVGRESAGGNQFFFPPHFSQRMRHQL